MFDVIVITAANAAQAKGYRAQTASLVGKLAPKILVVPDPGGKRVGSLGSTTNVLRKYGRFVGKRVLICHSGGDSRRLPAYAAIGKAFVPVPVDGGYKTLFEIIVGNMAQLKLPKSGVLVVCGDLAPQFDYAACRFTRKGVTGVGYWDTVARGSRHGVFITDRSGVSSVNGFLQKPSPSVAKASGAVCHGNVVVDTGILWLDEETCGKIAAANWRTGDLYREFTSELLRGFAPFSVNVVKRCDFFHIGSSRELLERLGGGKEWVHGCETARGDMELGGQNVVTGVPAAYGRIKLAKGECLTSLPIGKYGWVHVKYRLSDNFKEDGKWDVKSYRLGKRKYSFGELMPLVNHERMISLANMVTVESPLRIDFAGGWSDTPPICYDLGGCVLNAAVLLNGKKPVRVTVAPIAAREVRVESLDLNKRAVYRSDREIARHTDPKDWGVLIKSALTVVGYRIADGGLKICISADVPKGSGLGTSSILGASLIEALGKVRGKNYSRDKICELTLALEREMCTGGGWQDQAGGLIPGVKLLSTTPGRAQKLIVKRLSTLATKRFAKFLNERALLYFTGQKRMARNVLRGVLDFYRENPSGAAVDIVKRLKSSSKTAFRAIKKGDWQTFCGAINGYWQSKKALDPGSTNPFVESIIARVAPYASAISLCGAGGGGFMLIVAKNCQSRSIIREHFAVTQNSRYGELFDFSIDEGLM